jgi:hypothetical protein
MENVKPKACPKSEKIKTEQKKSQARNDGEAFTSTTWRDGLDHIPVLVYYLTIINMQLQRSSR